MLPFKKKSLSLQVRLKCFEKRHAEDAVDNLLIIELSFHFCSTLLPNVLTINMDYFYDEKKNSEGEGGAIERQDRRRFKG